MKKSKKIIILVIGIILGAIGTVSAATLVASSNVTYSNENTSATNFKDALDELFESTHGSGSGSNTILKLGEVVGNGTIYATSISGYQNFTEDNFLISVYGVENGVTFWFTAESDSNYTGAEISAIEITTTYDSSTGLLTVSGLDIPLSSYNIGLGGKNKKTISNTTVKMKAFIYVIK